LIAIEKLILMLIMLTPNHPLNKQPTLRSEVAGYFAEAEKQYNVPHGLLPHWAYGESKLKMSAIGKDRPSIGYGQIHGVGRIICEVVGHDPTTREGNIYCMGLLMAIGIEKCGSLERGVRWYARGTCRADRVSARTNRRIKQRLRAWRKVTR